MRRRMLNSLLRQPNASRRSSPRLTMMETCVLGTQTLAFAKLGQRRDISRGGGAVTDIGGAEL